MPGHALQLKRCPQTRRYYFGFPFRARTGHIIVFTRIWRPTGNYVFNLALDTGATDTMLDAQLLIDIGYDLALGASVPVTTDSGIVQVPEIAAPKLEALDQTRTNFPTLAHTLPPTATVGGVLGLDFLRGQVLNIGFRLRRLTLD